MQIRLIGVYHKNERKYNMREGKMDAAWELAVESQLLHQMKVEGDLTIHWLVDQENISSPD